MPDSALPPKLQIFDKDGNVIGSKNHWDWPWPFSKIPRGWTAFKWGAPKKIAGNQESEIHGAPKPIGEPGSWQLSRYENGPWYAWYFAFTLKSGRHFRIGARWDDVDDYVQFPTVASRKYSGGDNQDTSTGSGG